MSQMQETQVWGLTHKECKGQSSTIRWENIKVASKISKFKSICLNKLWIMCLNQYNTMFVGPNSYNI
jgi:hypothetical protein